jgi:sarcosine oxidase
MEQYDVVVIGAGVMGAATAYHLARRGRRVLLLEQFAIGHERGSSHGHSRIFRLAYDSVDYIRLAQAALPLWRELEQLSGSELLCLTGGLDIADRATPAIAATQTALRACGLPYELIDRATAAKRFPQFALGEGMVGLYQPTSGFLDATSSVLTLVDQARRHGAVVLDESPVLTIQPRSTGVEVRTSSAAYAAERLVITAGSWARPLLRQLGLDLPLTVTKEQFAFFRPHEPELFDAERCPIFIHHGSPSVYGFPIAGLSGVKVAFHSNGPVIAPESMDQSIEPEALVVLHAHLARLMPRAAGELIHAQTCRYTTTPDHEFIIDQHPEYAQILIGSPCSGHGFKFGILIGAILADLAEQGKTEHAIERFRLARFAGLTA